jgi:hypothetical protein
VKTSYACDPCDACRATDPACTVCGGAAFRARQLDLFPPGHVRRAPGTPATARDETAARDAALADLERTRAALIAVARVIARDIATARGRVTSVDVFRRLRADGLGAQLDAVDPRWMGAVFRGRDGWRQAGLEKAGSHRRPVAVWVLT